MRLIWSPEAVADLAAIHDYIGQLCQPGHGGAGQSREWLVPRYPSYLLIYEVGDDTVRILRVWHQSRRR